MRRIDQLLEGFRHSGCASCLEDSSAAYTYADLLEEFERWRSRFDQLRVEPGTVIALRGDYSLPSVAAFLALLSMRAVVAPVPRGQVADRCLSDARATALLDLSLDGQSEWRRLTDSTPHPLLERLRNSGDGGVVLFTSGSTGGPKAALHGSEGFLRKFDRPGRRFRTLAFLLFDHVAGLDTLFYTLVSGGTVILTRRRDPESILKIIQSHRVEVLPTSPSFLRLLCLARLDGDYDLSSLKIITYGSEAMDPSTLARLNTIFPTVQINQKYGTTETGSPKSVSRSSDSLWMKFREGDVEAKVIDGVLWIRSQSTILGYLNAPSPVDQDGWYCTSDLVEVDGEWFRFCGRLTDTIHVGGEKVAPTEVEHSILELDFVREAVVIGRPNALLGQVVTARVTLAVPDMEPKEAARRIWQHCRRRLAPYKAPVKIDISLAGFTDERQKVRRNQHGPDGAALPDDPKIS